MSHKQDSNTPGYEKRDASVRSIMITSLVSVIAVVLTVVLLYDYFVVTKEAIVFEQSLEPESQELLDLQGTEDSVLSSYELIDSANAVYRIPIERAMELLATEAAGTRREN